MNMTCKFSDAQWKFLSVMTLFESPVSVDVLGALMPLSPSELLDLMERWNELRVINQVESRTYSIEKDLPSNIKKRIEKFHTAKNISRLIAYE